MKNSLRTFYVSSILCASLTFVIVALVNSCAGDGQKPTPVRGEDDRIRTPSRVLPKPEALPVSADNKCRAVFALRDPATPLGSTAELKERFLKGHNDVRRIYNLPDLIWDENLANYAQRWAQHLKEKNGCNMMHRKVAQATEDKQYGENLAWYQGKAASPEAVTYYWSRECKGYRHANNSCAGVCGHFTQVIWKNTEAVGCGMAKCENTRTEVWVCNYDPPGNWRGEKPY